LIYAKLALYPNLTIVTFIEPDSLPNLVTNTAVAKCQTALTAYKTCVAYAIQKLATLPNVAIYVDAAHGGWLGWDANRNGSADIFLEVLTNAGGINLIRGFATNTANYQPLGSLTSTADPCKLMTQYNFAIDESHYVNLLDQTLQTRGFSNMHYVIDTSRNGITDERSVCSNWCNIKGSGLGLRPSTDTSSVTGVAVIDAFWWIKVPGESDGTSNSSAPRYDGHCGSVDSAINAPQAGQWFLDFFVALCNNAVPSLSSTSTGTGTSSSSTGTGTVTSSSSTGTGTSSSSTGTGTSSSSTGSGTSTSKTGSVSSTTSGLTSFSIKLSICFIAMIVLLFLI